MCDNEKKIQNHLITTGVRENSQNSYRFEYCKPPIDTVLNISLFCVIVPVLSEKI